MNAQIIAIANQKGGVGKTTTCANLGIGLAQEGKKVLLIDGDPQGSLSISLGYSRPDTLPVTLSDMMGKVLTDTPIQSGEGILHHAEGVDLMPADIQLSGMEVSLVNAMSRETILRQYLETVKHQYSHILIDCQPSLGMLTVNALAAANRVLIPVQAEYLPAKGLEQLLQTISKVRRQINPKLQIDGILLTMVDGRTNFAKEISALLRETYGSKIKVFGSEIPHSVRAKEISAEGMKDLTRWGRDYLQVGNAMEIFRRNNVRFIAVNNGIDSEKPDTLEFAPFINIMSEWYAKDISKKVKTGIKTKGMSGKPIATEAPYGYVKSPDNKDFWIIDEEAAGVVRLIFRLFLDGKNRNQIAVYLTQAQIPTPTFYMKERGRGTCKNRALNEANRYKWNKATLTHILTRQEYCGDVVNFKTTKHFRDKRNHYVDRSQWQITENVHEPIIDRTDFETVQRILENAPVKRPNGDGEIHPLSGLLFCKDCGAKMHIRIDYRNGGKRHVAYCSEYHKGKAKNPKCNSPHIIDADLLMQTIAEVLKKIEDYSISNRAEFEALVKKNLAMQQTDQTKKQQKRIPQITTRLEQIDKVLNKLYEDNALGTIPQDRYEQMSQKYSEEYYALKTELSILQEQLSAYENAGGRAQKFLKLTERHAAFTDLTPAILNEFISRIEVHERDQKRARYAIQHISIYFNYIGRFENEVTQLAEPTEQEIRQMREEIEEAKKEKSRAYHRKYSREYRARNLEKQREYERIKAREYRARRKAQTAAAQPAQ